MGKPSKEILELFAEHIRLENLQCVYGVVKTKEELEEMFPLKEKEDD